MSWYFPTARFAKRKTDEYSNSQTGQELALCKRTIIKSIIEGRTETLCNGLSEGETKFFIDKGFHVVFDGSVHKIDWSETSIENKK